MKPPLMRQGRRSDNPFPKLSREAPRLNVLAPLRGSRHFELDRGGGFWIQP